MELETFIAISGQILTVGVAYGFMKKTMDFHAEKFTEHSKKLSDLDEDKVDQSLHDSEVKRIDGLHNNLSHRVSNIDQRVHGLEVKR